MAADTDRVWDHLAKTDPYWAVLTLPQFHKDQLTQDTLADFFLTGERHVEFVLDTIHGHFDPSFAPWACLDFGCGVGRLVIPFAQKCRAVVGVDVSEAMLEEARRNCRRLDITNVEFVQADDQLAQLSGKFDLVHSFVVLQHLDPARGQALLKRLVDRIADHGFGVFHILYATQFMHQNTGHNRWLVAGKRLVRGAIKFVKRLLVALGCREPQMQMNAYDLNAVLTQLQEAGIRRSFLQFTDHGGERGVVVFFQKVPGEGYVV